MDIEKMTYEAAITRLKEVVELLERGNLEMDKSIALFKEATVLTNHCEVLLKDAEEQMTVLMETTGL